MRIVRDSATDSDPTVSGTAIRVRDVAVAYEHEGYEPEEIILLYPDLSLAAVHRSLAFYYDHRELFRSVDSRDAATTAPQGEPSDHDTV